jgi:hypothetical protein
MKKEGTQAIVDSA